MMDIERKRENRTELYRILCVLTTAAASLPVAGGHIVSAGPVAGWVSIVCMLGIQAGTMIFSRLFFEKLFVDSGSEVPAFFGMLLYMTCPYRIYVCYDLADLSMAAAWMLLPLYARAVLGLIRQERPIWKNVCIGALALAGAGYADTVFFLILAGTTLLAALCFRAVLPVMSAAAGGMLFLPGLYRLAQYLFTDVYREWDPPVRSIMADGYRAGEFFGSYFFRDGHPGMGLGMLVCLLTWLWIRFAGGNGRRAGRERFFVGTALLFLVLATRYFPWDIVQRLGNWALKLVALIRLPTVFAGMAWACLCIPAAGAMESVDDVEGRMRSGAIRLLALAACLGICVFQCSRILR